MVLPCPCGSRCYRAGNARGIPGYNRIGWHIVRYDSARIYHGIPADHRAGEYCRICTYGSTLVNNGLSRFPGAVITRWMGGGAHGCIRADKYAIFDE